MLREIAFPGLVMPRSVKCHASLRGSSPSFLTRPSVIYTNQEGFQLVMMFGRACNGISAAVDRL